MFRFRLEHTSGLLYTSSLGGGDIAYRLALQERRFLGHRGNPIRKKEEIQMGHVSWYLNPYKILAWGIAAILAGLGIYGVLSGLGSRRVAVLFGIAAVFSVGGLILSPPSPRESIGRTWVRALVNFLAIFLQFAGAGTLISGGFSGDKLSVLVGSWFFAAGVVIEVSRLRMLIPYVAVGMWLSAVLWVFLVSGPNNPLPIRAFVLSLAGLLLIFVWRFWFPVEAR